MCVFFFTRDSFYNHFRSFVTPTSVTGRLVCIVILPNRAKKVFFPPELSRVVLENGVNMQLFSYVYTAKSVTGCVFVRCAITEQRRDLSSACAVR